MGQEKKKKLTTKAKTPHASNKVDKLRRKNVEKKLKRKMEKKNRIRDKIEVENDNNVAEQDDTGFFKLPGEFALEDEDQAVLNALGPINFGQSNSKASKELASMIDELDKKIENKTNDLNEDNLLNDPGRNEKVRLVYQDIADILSTYRSGKLPKALKVAPMTESTFQLLKLTAPERWTPHAMYGITLDFSQSMSSDKFKTFLQDILLPAVRKDIKKSKKLNYHYYCSLRKALFKPAWWFRGILFPLCEAEDLSIKEAEIFASIISRKSIPSVHSAISILKLTQMNYTGPVNVLLLSLVKKKYALPRSVISATYDWIMKFDSIEQKLPVIWFKTVLVFSEAYSINDQKIEIRNLVKRKHKHKTMSPIIVRALLSRGDSLNVTMIDDSRMIF